jgi:hypothetical protein
VPESQKDRGRIAVAVPVVAGRLDQPLDGYLGLSRSLRRPPGKAGLRASVPGAVEQDTIEPFGTSPAGDCAMTSGGWLDKSRSPNSLFGLGAGAMLGATVTVTWGYELHSITLTSKNWAKVKSGKALRLRGKGYRYEGEFFWDYWSFGGGLDETLLVEYGDDGGTGFDGTLRDATIKEQVVRRAT